MHTTYQTGTHIHAHCNSPIHPNTRTHACMQHAPGRDGPIKDLMKATIVCLLKGVFHHVDFRASNSTFACARRARLCHTHQADTTHIHTSLIHAPGNGGVAHSGSTGVAHAGNTGVHIAPPPWTRRTSSPPSPTPACGNCSSASTRPAPRPTSPRSSS